MWYTALGSRNCWGAWSPSLPQDPAYQQLPLDYYHYLDTAITLMMKRHYPGRRTIIMNHHFGMFYNCAKLIGCNSCLSNHQTHSYSGWQTRVSELNSFLEDNDHHLENPEDIGSSGSAHGNATLTCIDCCTLFHQLARVSELKTMINNRSLRRYRIKWQHMGMQSSHVSTVHCTPRPGQ